MCFLGKDTTRPVLNPSEAFIVPSVAITMRGLCLQIRRGREGADRSVTAAFILHRGAVEAFGNKRPCRRIILQCVTLSLLVGGWALGIVFCYFPWHNTPPPAHPLLPRPPPLLPSSRSPPPLPRRGRLVCPSHVPFAPQPTPVTRLGQVPKPTFPLTHSLLLRVRGKRPLTLGLGISLGRPHPHRRGPPLRGREVGVP